MKMRYMRLVIILGIFFIENVIYTANRGEDAIPGSSSASQQPTTTTYTSPQPQKKRQISQQSPNTIGQTTITTQIPPDDTSKPQNRRQMSQQSPSSSNDSQYQGYPTISVPNTPQVPLSGTGTQQQPQQNPNIPELNLPEINFETPLTQKIQRKIWGAVGAPISNRAANIGQSIYGAGSTLAQGVQSVAGGIGTGISAVGSGLGSVQEYLSPSDEGLLEAALTLPCLEKTIEVLKEIVRQLASNSQYTGSDHLGVDGNIYGTNTDLEKLSFCYETALKGDALVEASQASKRNETLTPEDDVLANLNSKSLITNAYIRRRLDENNKEYNANFLIHLTTTLPTLVAALRSNIPFRSAHKDHLIGYITNNINKLDVLRSVLAIRIGKEYGFYKKAALYLGGAAISAAVWMKYFKS